MFTLHDTIELTKKILLYGAIALFVIFLLFMLFRLGVFLKNTLFPTPPPAAQAGFGKLPAIDFGEPDGRKFTYTIDTLSGSLPSLPDRLNVHKFVEQFPEFFDLTHAKAKAESIGFTSQPDTLGENLFRWTINSDLQPVLTINSLTDDFTLTSSFMTYPAIVNNDSVPSQDDAISDAETFFRTLNSFPDAINTASTSATALRIQNGELVGATNVDTVQLYRIDYQLDTVDTLPIYFPHSPSSLIYAIVASGLDLRNVVEAGYVYRALSDEVSDYPIKSADEAYQELQKGQGHIASYFGRKNTITITDVQLGYYLSDKPGAYLMPIIVFKGNEGFLGYVSAIQNPFIGE